MTGAARCGVGGEGESGDGAEGGVVETHLERSAGALLATFNHLDFT